ncbi:YpfB family protein [Bacillus suaedaesalsae]|uniref:YpfB family protein n=1 Tax=Bacillus suaedaesalsae TaxID=2810349 RepID=A0ABS2DQ27_9BACI|nr:YpfB family protein [Bacillus suaedaesalsae]MBM6619886.1 YpfB family protein [Bacillus suaedaesalsae]
MKRFESILVKLVIIQFIFLIVAQFVMMNGQVSPYLSKVIQYEGVTKDTYTKIVETFNQ